MRRSILRKTGFLCICLMLLAGLGVPSALAVPNQAHQASVPLASKALFAGVDDGFYDQLWITDGTVAGTQVLTKEDCVPNGLSPSNITVLSPTKAVFIGCSNNLWVTDGTAAGTQVMTGMPDATAAGLRPLDIVNFGSQVLFDGFNKAGNEEVWISDGTGPHTTEVTSAKDGGNFLGRNFVDITPFGKLALFSDQDTNGTAGLWVTDGTPAGTSPLSVKMTNGTLMHPAGLDLVAFGNKVLFNGTNADPRVVSSALWVTGGTTATSQELLNSEPFSITAAEKQAFFTTYDGNLWRTDGTVAGTQQVTKYAYSFSASDITAFGSKALFYAHDAQGGYGLWITDGTGAGTQEIVALNKASSPQDDDIAVLGNEALFYGEDASGSGQLWLTDGTKAGTKEMTSVSSDNFHNGLQPADITVDGDEALFAGYDGAGNNQLWLTDGTTKGTTELQPIVGADSNGFDPASLTLLNPLTSSPPPVSSQGRHQVFFLLSGFTSSLDKQADVPGGFNPPSGPGLVKMLKQQFPDAAIQMYSYVSPTNPSYPAYSCANTFDQTPETYAGYLQSQINSYAEKHPDTDFYLLGGSFGGVVAYAFLETYLTDHSPALPNGGRIAGIVTLDSPLGGLPAGFMGIDTSILEAAFHRLFAGCEDVTNFTSVESLNQTFNNSREGKAYGANDLLVPLKGHPLSGPTGGFSNEYYAIQGARQDHIAVLTLGNPNDFIFNLSVCAHTLGFAPDSYLSTQWITDLGAGSQVYARSIVAGSATCPGLLNSFANHSIGWADPATLKAIAQFLNGQTPSLSVPSITD